ncbi:MAG: alanine--tRNA ligase [Deltaproteobacteria bacterium CG11_big_fil_rev_8_21_14_0_20_47_16]|nr:MAG: alanine--tRNA ligase [Deltaproteobacteria bacterium CG11_big_fil_rev_8_21_14_0_20_47_16]
MKASELREQFLKYFEANGHAREASGSLIPSNDPTLFFANAGMVQFKDCFLGNDKRAYTRATTSQKCMRVSGKHNDLENVGRTKRHHTFFEMLGNFSFGDYFKKEAIAFAWEFLTKVVKLPEDKLYITVFEDDDEAAKLWEKHVDKARIFRCGEKDNFWSMGDTGPCGPCSEIHYDRGGKGKVVSKDLENGRLMEIWNLVFMQFDRDASGKLNNLPKPSVDTGMGLERLAAVVQGVDSNYDTDLFTPILRAIESATGKKYTGTFSDGVANTPDVSMRVVADHIRAMTFLIADGVQPSNEGRGYVLRRIMRRAMRHGKMLGMNKPFLVPVAHVVMDEMGSAFPEIVRNRHAIENMIHHEELRFFETLERGLAILDEQFAMMAKSKTKVVPGDMAFKLYDTFGFPKDLTADIAAEQGYSIDDAGFDACMDKQRQQARDAWKGSGEDKVADVYKDLHQQGVASAFLGYTADSAKAEVVAIVKDGKVVKAAKAGDKVQIVCDETPFYGASGGQMGDTGVMLGDGIEVEVTDTTKPLPTIFVHHAVVKRGTIQNGTTLTLAIDNDRRAALRRNHTATHLLHKALRATLGEHVRQAGSLVAPDRLRFDFSHFAAITPEQLRDIERDVNAHILANIPVTTHELSYDEAIARGALAFFGDKYGKMVRMVDVPGYSTELCGGTHVTATGDIGLCKITQESSVAAGVRRLEAVTGEGALAYVESLEDDRRQLAQNLKSGPDEVVSRVSKLMEQQKTLEREIQTLKSKLVSGSASDVMSQVKDVNGIKLLATEVPATSVAELRQFADQYKDKIGSGVVVLGAAIDGKAALIATVTKDLAGKIHAGNIIKQLAAQVGGTGGGRPDMAQGGGPDVAALSGALDKSSQLLS